jgi:hypothetical protein
MKSALVRSLFISLLVFAALIVGNGSVAQASDDPGVAGRCNCQAQGNYYVLWYTDTDGNRHVIYTYNTYPECAQGLANTALCNIRGNEAVPPREEY